LRHDGKVAVGYGVVIWRSTHNPAVAVSKEPHT